LNSVVYFLLQKLLSVIKELESLCGKKYPNLIAMQMQRNLMVCMKSVQVAVWSRMSVHISQRYTWHHVHFPCFLFYISCGERVYVIQIHSSLLQTSCCSLILLSPTVIIWKLQWTIAEIVLWYEASRSTIALWSTIGAHTNCMHFILSCFCVSSAVIFLPRSRHFKLKNGHNQVHFGLQKIFK
jgi:hypothetical protein